MPRLPWRLITLGTLSISAVFGGYYVNQQRRAETLRSQMLQVYEGELAEPRRRYLAFRGKLESLILGASSKAPEAYADKRLRVPGLRAGKGLYLRLNANEARSRRGIERQASTMESDAIAACLGLAPASARTLWTKGAFLLPDAVKQLRATEGVMPLRVADDMLARQIRTNLPVVLDLVRSDWFMLVLEPAGGRRAEPVDVFLWDLRTGEQLLRGRVQSAGVVLSARIQSKDAPGSPRLTESARNDGAVVDCSIAAKIKALAGTPAAMVENLQPAPTPAVAIVPPVAQQAPPIPNPQPAATPSKP